VFKGQVMGTTLECHEGRLFFISMLNKNNSNREDNLHPNVSFIILNWNGVNDTLECLQSVCEQDYPFYDVIVVDNDSSDNSVEIIKNEYPDVIVIENQENLGYAGGNNVGLEFAAREGLEYLFVINNDLVLKKDCLSNLINDIEGYPKAGAIAPISFYYDRPEVVDFAGGKIITVGTIKYIKKSHHEIEALQEPYLSDWLLGCAILIRKSVFDQVGGFDPRYFLLFEDSDWSLKVRRAGYDLMMSPKAWVYHKVSSSFKQTWSPTYFYYYTRNTFLFYENNFPILARITLSFLQLLRLIKQLLKLIILNPKEAWLLINSFFYGITDYLSRNYGELEKTRH